VRVTQADEVHHRDRGRLGHLTEALCAHALVDAARRDRAQDGRRVAQQ
jgi:hypothetical protein